MVVLAIALAVESLREEDTRAINVGQGVSEIRIHVVFQVDSHLVLSL